jgi:hypothetical protein
MDNIYVWLVDLFNGREIVAVTIINSNVTITMKTKTIYDSPWIYAYVIQFNVFIYCGIAASDMFAQ